MKNKYWAKNKYSTVDPLDYEIARFRTNAGKLIDEAEKRAVLDLLLNSGIDYKKDFKILDAATGPGRLAFYLSDHLREAKITGVDINENMLRRAREIAGQKKGLFLCGETILRTFPEKLLFILSVFVRPPLFLQNFSTKIVLCFRKIEL